MVQEKIEEAINFLHMHKKPELKGSVRQFQNHLKYVWLDRYWLQQEQLHVFKILDSF
jgi:hypothetical protein